MHSLPPSPSTSSTFSSNTIITFLEAEHGQTISLDQALDLARRHDQLADLGGKLQAMLDQEEQVRRWGLPDGELTLHREVETAAKHEIEPRGQIRYNVLMAPTFITTHLLMPREEQSSEEPSPRTTAQNQKSWASRLDEAMQRVESGLWQ